MPPAPALPAAGAYLIRHDLGEPAKETGPGPIRDKLNALTSKTDYKLLKNFSSTARLAVSLATQADVIGCAIVPWIFVW
jgi:hypothetical protein